VSPHYSEPLSRLGKCDSDVLHRIIDMKTVAILIEIIALSLGVCHAGSSDDTAKFYLSKSDVVLHGTMLEGPLVFHGSSGIYNHSRKFKVSDVLKGDSTLKGTTVRVNIISIGFADPLIHTKNTECILFLKQSPNNVPHLETADFWFGIQYPFPWMIKSLKRLAKQEKKNVTQDGKATAMPKIKEMTESTNQKSKIKNVEQTLSD